MSDSRSIEPAFVAPSAWPKSEAIEQFIKRGLVRFSPVEEIAKPRGTGCLQE